MIVVFITLIIKVFRVLIKMGLRRLISYYFSSNGNQSATTPTSPANLKENLDKSMLNFEEHSSFLK
jgi:hypothetical protein